jgi:hypothetical protein
MVPWGILGRLIAETAQQDPISPIATAIYWVFHFPTPTIHNPDYFDRDLIAFGSFHGQGPEPLSIPPDRINPVLQLSVTCTVTSFIDVHRVILFQLLGLLT